MSTQVNCTPAATLVHSKIALTTALTRLVFGDDVRYIWVNADADILLVYDNTKSDGAAIDATNQFRIPAGTNWPILNDGIRPLIAAATGTANAWVHGTRQ